VIYQVLVHEVEVSTLLEILDGELVDYVDKLTREMLFQPFLRF